MRVPRAVLRLGITAAFIAGLTPAAVDAATTFSRSLAELSPADREAMERARREVLEKMTPGAVAVWKDDKTGHSGEARLRRTYEQNGMTCGEVEHVLNIRQVSRFVVPLCRANDGTWRLAY